MTGTRKRGGSNLYFQEVARGDVPYQRKATGTRRKMSLMIIKAWRIAFTFYPVFTRSGML